MGLYVQEATVEVRDDEHRYGLGESDVYESYTDSVGELYRANVREHGRCTGKVYVDRDGKTEAIGWVFVKRCQYEDCTDTYLRETWVTVHDAPDTVTREHHWHTI